MPRRSPPGRHAQRIQAGVAGTLGVECPVIVKSAKDMAAVVAGNAFAATATDPSRLLVALTQDAKGLAECGTTRNWATVEKIHALLQETA